MGPGDQAILVTHQPRWLSDWFWDETACHNLRQLVRGHLRGRARVHLAGQLPYSPASVHGTKGFPLYPRGYNHACAPSISRKVPPLRASPLWLLQSFVAPWQNRHLPDDVLWLVVWVRSHLDVMKAWPQCFASVDALGLEFA